MTEPMQDPVPDPVPDPMPDPMPDPLADLETDPALAAAVLEIETHAADAGWDQPARLFALVDTGALVAQEPALAQELGLDGPAEAGSLTAVEQEQLPADQPLERVLESIAWPAEVTGCAAVVERLVLPPGSDEGLPEDPVAAQEYAADHPDRQEVRIVAGATRERCDLLRAAAALPRRRHLRGRRRRPGARPADPAG